MEMTAVCLGKLAKTASFPHSHSLGDDLEFLFSPSSFNFNFDESVTYMPGTFCYRYPRSHMRIHRAATNGRFNCAPLAKCLRLSVKKVAYAIPNNCP